MPSTRKQPNNSHLVIRYFRLGQKLRKHGSAADVEAKQLAAESGLGESPGVRYRSYELAARFEYRELVSLCRVRENGSRINLSQICELMVVSDAKQREKLAAFAAKRNLSCLALRAQVRSRRDWKNRRPKAGRERRDPVNRADAVLRAAGQARALQETLEWLKKAAKKTDNLDLQSAIRMLGHLLVGLGSDPR